MGSGLLRTPRSQGVLPSTQCAECGQLLSAMALPVNQRQMTCATAEVQGDHLTLIAAKLSSLCWEASDRSAKMRAFARMSSAGTLVLSRTSGCLFIKLSSSWKARVQVRLATSGRRAHPHDAVKDWLSAILPYMSNCCLTTN